MPDKTAALLRLIRDAQSTKDSRRLVLWALALRADIEKGCTCDPCHRQIAEDTGVHPQTAKEAIRDLAKQGLILRQKRTNDSNLYKINITLLMQQAAAAKGQSKEEPAAQRFALTEEERQALDAA